MPSSAAVTVVSQNPAPLAAGSLAPRQEELLFTQTALLSRTTHISRRYAIKHADPKCHKQVRAAPWLTQLLMRACAAPLQGWPQQHFQAALLFLRACVARRPNSLAAVVEASDQIVPTSSAQLSSALSAHITSLLVRLVANARHRSDGGGRRVVDLEYEQDVRIAIGAVQREAKREADRCAATPAAVSCLRDRQMTCMAVICLLNDYMLCVAQSRPCILLEAHLLSSQQRLHATLTS